MSGSESESELLYAPLARLEASPTGSLDDFVVVAESLFALPRWRTEHSDLRERFHLVGLLLIKNLARRPDQEQVSAMSDLMIATRSIRDLELQDEFRAAASQAIPHLARAHRANAYTQLIELTDPHGDLARARLGSYFSLIAAADVFMPDERGRLFKRILTKSQAATIRPRVPTIAFLLAAIGVVRALPNQDQREASMFIRFMISEIPEVAEIRGLALIPGLDALKLVLELVETRAEDLQVAFEAALSAVPSLPIDDRGWVTAYVVLRARTAFPRGFGEWDFATLAMAAVGDVLDAIDRTVDDDFIDDDDFIVASLRSMRQALDAFADAPGRLPVLTTGANVALRAYERGDSLPSEREAVRYAEAAVWIDALPRGEAQTLIERLRARTIGPVRLVLLREAVEPDFLPQSFDDRMRISAISMLSDDVPVKYELLRLAFARLPTTMDVLLRIIDMASQLPNETVLPAHQHREIIPRLEAFAAIIGGRDRDLAVFFNRLNRLGEGDEGERILDALRSGLAAIEDRQISAPTRGPTKALLAGVLERAAAHLEAMHPGRRPPSRS